MDAAFLAAIAASPDDDLARLVYADWLDEHGDAGDAERIRLAVRLDPDRDRFDDPAINALRDRVEELTPGVTGLPPGVEVEWRRGLPDALCVPAPAFVEHGAALREQFPTARRLVLFRLNGWGTRVAGCEHLRGVRDLELACWYADADAEALADSPHVADVERLTLWAGENQEHVASAFVGSPAAHKLREYHLVSLRDNAEWAEYVNEIAGESATATVYEFDGLPLPFAPDFSDGFLVGRLADDAQVFAADDLSRPTLFGVRFDRSGREARPFRMALPPELVFPTRLDPSRQPLPDGDEARAVRAARRAFAAAAGLTPAFIRVRPFVTGDRRHGTETPYLSAGRDGGMHVFPEDFWGVADDPVPDPDHFPGGVGVGQYRYVREGWVFVIYDGREWSGDRTGRGRSTY